MRNNEFARSFKIAFADSPNDLVPFIAPTKASVIWLPIVFPISSNESFIPFVSSFKVLEAVVAVSYTHLTLPTKA